MTNHFQYLLRRTTTTKETKMTDPRNKTSTWCTFGTSTTPHTRKTDTDSYPETDTTYGAYEDDAITDYGLRGTSDIKPYNDASASGVRGYDPADYSTSSNFESGTSTAAYDPITGAYEEHTDYRTDEGAQRHHRERVDASGTYEVGDVDRFDDGTSWVRREYNNPETGVSFVREYQQ